MYFIEFTFVNTINASFCFRVFEMYSMRSYNSYPADKIYSPRCVYVLYVQQNCFNRLQHSKLPNFKTSFQLSLVSVLSI